MLHNLIIPRVCKWEWRVGSSSWLSKATKGKRTVCGCCIAKQRSSRWGCVSKDERCAGCSCSGSRFCGPKWEGGCWTNGTKYILSRWLCRWILRRTLFLRLFNSYFLIHRRGLHWITGADCYLRFDFRNLWLARLLAFCTAFNDRTFYFYGLFSFWSSTCFRILAACIWGNWKNIWFFLPRLIYFQVIEHTNWGRPFTFNVCQMSFIIFKHWGEYAEGIWLNMFSYPGRHRHVQAFKLMEVFWWRFVSRLGRAIGVWNCWRLWVSRSNNEIEIRFVWWSGWKSFEVAKWCFLESKICVMNSWKKSKEAHNYRRVSTRGRSWLSFGLKDHPFLDLIRVGLLEFTCSFRFGFFLVPVVMV